MFYIDVQTQVLLIHVLLVVVVLIFWVVFKIVNIVRIRLLFLVGHVGVGLTDSGVGLGMVLDVLLELSHNLLSYALTLNALDGI